VILGYAVKGEGIGVELAIALDRPTLEAFQRAAVGPLGSFAGREGGQPGIANVGHSDRRRAARTTATRKLVAGLLLRGDQLVAHHRR